MNLITCASRVKESRKLCGYCLFDTPLSFLIQSTSYRLIFRADNTIVMVGEIEHEFLVFSADSPLFEVAATDAVNDILHLSDFLSSIIAKMRNLCDNLKQTALTGSALASQMQEIGIGGSLKNSGFVSPVLKHFGGILSGISSSQEILADCIENVFIAPLQAFTIFEIPKIALLQQQYKKEHQANEESILRYLQGDTPNSFGMSRNASQAVLGLRALEVVQQRKKLEMSRFNFVRGVNAIKAQKNFEIDRKSVV